VPDATMGRRISRAKQPIFFEGYATSGGPDLENVALSNEATVWRASSTERGRTRRR
jgi:hypothetical protein